MMAEDNDLESQENTRSTVPKKKTVNGDSTKAYLVWKDLTVKVNRKKKTILHGLSGFAEPERVLAIMGPSGSGKSTLLDTLAGRQPRTTHVSGRILLNGRKARLSYGTAAYVAQEVLLMGTLTVYETLYYSAKFRFPDGTTQKETNEIVMEALEEVGLVDVANTRIGNWYTRGISGGEKKRVSIAMELLTSPRLIFMDEPTTGLDSSSSYHVISTLKSLSRYGRTILCSIHQPSSEVFELFDNLCLLSDGKQIFFGALPQALNFFTKNGLPCPPLRSPSDHYLHCVNADFDTVQESLDKSASTSSAGRLHLSGMGSVKESSELRINISDTVEKLTQAYSVSEEKGIVDAIITDMTQKIGEVFDNKGSQASFFTQAFYLTMRSFINMHRDIAYFWLRIGVYILLCVCLGTVFYDIGHSFASIRARSALVTFAVGFMTLMAVGGYPAFIEDMKIFEMERMNGHYRVAAFVVGNSTSSIPYIFIIAAISTALTYPLAKLHGGAVHVIYFLLNLFACLLVAESNMMAIASTVTNFLLGIMLAGGLQGVFLLVSGFFRLPNDLPNPIWKYPLHYVGYLTYGYQGMMQNEVEGQCFRGRLPGSPTLNGDFVLRDILQVKMSRSKWWNLAIVFGIAVGVRMIFYILLNIRESTFPQIWRYSKKSRLVWSKVADFYFLTALRSCLKARSQMKVDMKILVNNPLNNNIKSFQHVRRRAL